MGHEKQPTLLKVLIATKINKSSGATSSFSIICLSGTVAYGRGKSFMVPGGKHWSSDPQSI